MARKDSLLAELAAIEEQEAKLKSIRPHDWFKALPGGQIAFWNSPKKERWLFGANQSGKTITLINKCVSLLRGKPGIRGYIGSASMDRSRKVVQKKFWDWINKDELAESQKYRQDEGFKNDSCMLRNGSIVFFLSYEMDQDKWASDTLDFIAFDEEPPWHIFTEAQKRVAVKDGFIFGAMTALKSYTRLVERIYLSGNPNIGLYIVPLHENHVRHGGIYTDERIAQIIEETPESERPSRIFGIPTYRTGIVYDTWKDEEPWVIPFVKEFAIPAHWTRYCAIDPHASINQASLMIAVNQQKEMFAYKELWLKTLIPDFARKLREEQTPVQFEVTLIDNHYSTQKNAESGKTIKELLMEYGDIETVGGCDDVIARIDMVKAWDKINPVTGRPLLQTFESCTQTRWERKRYEWANPISEKIAERRDAAQKPKEKNGHLMNCMEYLAAYGGKDGLEWFMPALSDKMLQRKKHYEQREQQERDMDPINSERDNYDETVSAMYE